MDPVTIKTIAGGARHTLVRTAGLVALLWAGIAAAQDYQVFGDGVQLTCWRMEHTRLVCDFRRFAPP